jgi:hypothetical protein
MGPVARGLADLTDMITIEDIGCVMFAVNIVLLAILILVLLTW